MTGEFDIIKRYFAPLAGPEGLYLKDDAACYRPRHGYDLIISKDMLVSSVHFFKNDRPSLIAQKLLAVNLSDIAAKGAFPVGYFLGLALTSSVDDAWLSDFSDGLQDGQNRYGFQLFGGDTTASNFDIVLSCTMIAAVPADGMVKRSGAAVGDEIMVTGTLGDSALGLQCLLGNIPKNDILIDRYHRPQPRLSLADNNFVSAATDISDGLLADLGHICAASNKGADIFHDALPLSNTARDILNKHPELCPSVYSGGDDYELVMTVSPSQKTRLIEKASQLNLVLTKIGEITDTNTVRLLDETGNEIPVASLGYSHFD